MTANTDNRRRWRLHWSVPSAEQAGMSADADGVTTLWIGSDDPVAIKAFVVAQKWTPDSTIEVSIEPGAGERPPRPFVICRPIHVAQWDPAERPLPLAVSHARPIRSRSQGRLLLLQAMRRGVDEAVAAGALHPEDGAGLMMLALEALDRHDREHRSEP